MKHRNRGKCHERPGHKLRKRLRKITTGSGFYRSRNGIFMGVLKGLATHFDFSVFWLRTIAVLAFIFTGFYPVALLYIIAGLILKIEPVAPLHNDNDKEFYETYAQSRKAAIQRIRRKYDNIERRIQRMEHTVTSKEFDW